MECGTKKVADFGFSAAGGGVAEVSGEGEEGLLAAKFTFEPIEEASFDAFGNFDKSDDRVFEAVIFGFLGASNSSSSELKKPS